MTMGGSALLREHPVKPSNPKQPIAIILTQLTLKFNYVLIDRPMMCLNFLVPYSIAIVVDSDKLSKQYKASRQVRRKGVIRPM